MIHSKSDLELEVVNRVELSNNIFEIELVSSTKTQLPDWSPGSHIDLFLPNGLVRQYSLISGNESRNNWRIAILVEGSGKGGSIWLYENLLIGTRIAASYPKNHFVLEAAREYLFIAGGIGITPILEMISISESEGIPWTLNYLGSNEESLPYSKYLLGRFGKKVNIFNKSKNQRFDISSAIKSISAETHVYCCGSERLMSAVEVSLSETPSRLHVERFHPREIVLSEPDREFTVYCMKSDVELLVQADESILMAADFEGIDIPGDCMEGTCGSCETRVIEGEVDHRDSVLSAKARAEGDTMMICVSRAKGNRLVIDL